MLQPVRLHQPKMTLVAKIVCSPPRVWGRVAVDLDDEEVVAVGLHQPIRRVARLYPRESDPMGSYPIGSDPMG